MHHGNREWLASLRAQYPEHFSGANVLEIGAYNVNGTARDFFKDAKRYVGVDREAGPCVDIVSQACDTSFKVGEFDTLVYLSVMEHDPDWKKGFVHNLKWMRPGGLIILCWGAEGNLYHLPDPWAIVPVKDFKDAAEKWPIEILDSFFEGTRFTPDCPGAYDLVARKRS